MYSVNLHVSVSPIYMYMYALHNLIIIIISYMSVQGCVCIEVHQALGLKYQRLAVSSVRLKDIIANSGGKVHGKAVLSGVESIGECVSAGTLDYWIKLKLPITQAIRLYQVSITIFQCHKRQSSSHKHKAHHLPPENKQKLDFSINKHH